MAQPSVLPLAVEAQLDRILASREFQNSGRMCRFLRFTVQTTLAGKVDELKEYSIAVAVFDRELGFDQRIDPVVRNEARRLRRKLETYYATEGADDPLVIELPKGAYVPSFRERVLSEPDSTVSEVPENTALVENSPDRETPFRRKRWFAMAVLVAVLAFGVGGFFLARPYLRRPAAQPIRSVAVLPFQNMTGDSRMDYVADGIADEILNSLAHIPELKVVARTSAAQFKSRTADTQEIGQRLGVKTLLEGSVRSSGDKLRVLPRLVNVETGYQLWSQDYEFQTEDLFQVQDTIARVVAQQLGQQTGVLAERSPADNGEAYKEYILGRHYLLDLEDRAASLRKARGLLEHAVALDPHNANAWASLASAYGISIQSGLLPFSEGSKALEYGRKALEVDPNSADALANKGAEIAVLHHDWADSERLFRRALEQKPSDSLIHHSYSTCVLWSTMRLEEARKEQEKAIELDPLNADSRIALADTLYFQHQYEAANRAGQQALALNPNLQHAARNLLRSLVITGRTEDISSLMQRFWKDEPERSFALSMRAFAAKDIAAAKHYAQVALQRDQDPDQRANLYAVLGDERNLIRTFDSASLAATWQIDGAVLDPFYDPYRSSPQFQQLIKRVLAPQ